MTTHMYYMCVEKLLCPTNALKDTSRKDFGIILSPSIYMVSAWGITATQHAQAKALLMIM